ncbi:MAG: hypothetical protein ABIQ18_06290 [Umezawaea sp.]
MTDLRWDEVDDLFDVDNGILPDVAVPDTTPADWQAVLDLIRSKGWAYQYSQDGRPCRMPSAERILDRDPDMGVDLKVWPVPDVLAIFRFYAAEEIDFDVDLRELQGQERLDALCAFFRAVGRRLHKPVVMSFEGRCGPMIGYDVDRDRVVRLANRKLG